MTAILNVSVNLAMVPLLALLVATLIVIVLWLVYAIGQWRS